MSSSLLTSLVDASRLCAASSTFASDSTLMLREGSGGGVALAGLALSTCLVTGTGGSSSDSSVRESTRAAAFAEEAFILRARDALSTIASSSDDESCTCFFFSCGWPLRSLNMLVAFCTTAPSSDESDELSTRSGKLRPLRPVFEVAGEAFAEPGCSDSAAAGDEDAVPAALRASCWLGLWLPSVGQMRFPVTCAARSGSRASLASRARIGARRCLRGQDVCVPAVQV